MDFDSFSISYHVHLHASEKNILNNNTIGPFIQEKIRRVLHKTRLKQDVNFPYKRHISSKIRRDLAKTRKTSYK